MRRASTALAALVALAASVPLLKAQDSLSDLQRPTANKPPAVTYLFPEQLAISAGQTVSVDLHFRVAAGLHVNSHSPHTADLIPTTLKIPDSSGVHLVDAQYPAGADFTFAIDPAEKRSVYTGDFVVHAKLLAISGEHLVESTLRYQACNNQACMPPRTIPVVIDVIAK